MAVFLPERLKNRAILLMALSGIAVLAWALSMSADSEPQPAGAEVAQSPLQSDSV